MRNLVAAIGIGLCAYGLIATAAGLYGAALSLIGGGVFAVGRLAFAASGLLALVVVGGFADWLGQSAKPEPQGPEGMLR